MPDQYDEDEYRPRPRKNRKASGPPVGLIVGVVLGGLFLLIGFGVVTAAMLDGQPGQSDPRQARVVAGMGTTPPAADPPQVIITRVRRADAPGMADGLVLDFNLADGFNPVDIAVAVKDDRGQVHELEMENAAQTPRTGAWLLESNTTARLHGRMEVWVKDKLGPTGKTLSNIYVFNGR